MSRKPVRRPAAKRKPWEIEGVSRSTYFRNKRKAAASNKPTRRRPVSDPSGRPLLPPPGEQRPQQVALKIERSDFDHAVGEAVDRALVRNALTQLEVMLANAPQGSVVITMSGTTESWAACARALRKAGH